MYCIQVMPNRRVSHFLSHFLSVQPHTSCHTSCLSSLTPPVCPASHLLSVQPHTSCLPSLTLPVCPASNSSTLYLAESLPAQSASSRVLHLECCKVGHAADADRQQGGRVHQGEAEELCQGGQGEAEERGQGEAEELCQGRQGQERCTQYVKSR
jgi:hypothetical protein